MLQNVLQFFKLILFPAVIIIIRNRVTVTRLINTGGRFHSNTSEANKARKRQAIIVTFCVSSAFILHVGPLGIYVALWPFVFSESADLLRDQFGSRAGMIVYTVVSTLAQVNFAMYVLSGPRFRRDLKMTICGSNFNPDEPCHK